MSTDDGDAIVPEVDEPGTFIRPRTVIYDGADDGSFWFRRAGFTSKLTDED